MNHWTHYLTDAERQRIDELDEIKREAQGEFRRIYDRCRKRAARSLTHKRPEHDRA